MSETNAASPAQAKPSDLERLVRVQWLPTDKFPKEGLLHRRILAVGKSMPDCVGSYEDGYFILSDCVDHGMIFEIFEGGADWFAEHFDWWADWPDAP